MGQSARGLAVLACVANALSYVGLLYVWRGNLPRDHPTTIKRRIISTTLACSVAWLPVYFWATRVKPMAAPIPVHGLLGLRLEGLGRAIVDSLYLCITLFIGPLVYFVYTIDLEDPNESNPPGLEQPGALGKLAARVRRLVGDWRLWRNLVAAPLTEEWVFRACMAPLLVMEGLPLVRVVLLTPLFFGAAHLHHAAELVRHQHMPLGRALAAVTFQFAYTTLFGWLATFLFLRTGHLAAPLAAHVFCNWAGFPPFGEMWEHPRAIVLLLTTAGGLVTFVLQLGRMTAPSRYGNEVYGAGW
eukprot:XP_001690158.1 predicted protein [Chlamydomonas reinhardtii]